MPDALTRLLAWARHLAAGASLWRIVALSVGLAVGSLALAAFIIVRWPPEQFSGDAPPPFWPKDPAWLRILGRGGKNAGGILLVLLGVVMSLPGVPGQGILVILIGLTLLDLPGKRKVERRLVGRPLVARTVNLIRARFGRPPLELGGPDVRESVSL
jgi:hypothetical protein